MRADNTYGNVQHYIFKHDGSQGALNLVHNKAANILYVDGHSGTQGKESAYENGFSTYALNGVKHDSAK